MKLNKIDEVRNTANSLFKWRFLFVVIQKFYYMTTWRNGKIQLKTHLKSGCILSFFFSVDDKIIKCLWNIYALHKFLSKNVIFLTIEQKCTWKVFKNFDALVGFQNRSSCPSPLKTSLNSLKHDFVTKSFLSRQKENWAFTWTFRYICVF